MKLLYIITILLLLLGCDRDNSNTSTQTSNTKYEPNTAVQNNEAAALYESCQPCHGVNAERNALGKSRIIADFNQEEIIDAIEGYQNGTRNIYEMGGLMKGQVIDLTDYETKILANYITNL